MTFIDVPGLLVHRTERRLESNSYFSRTNETFYFVIYTIKLQDAVTLGGAYKGGGASSAGQCGHVIRYSGQ